MANIEKRLSDLEKSSEPEGRVLLRYVNDPFDHGEHWQTRDGQPTDLRPDDRGITIEYIHDWRPREEAI